MTMRTLVCSLAAVLSVALGSAVFAASAEDLQITGTVVEYHPMMPASLVIETADKKRWEFFIDSDFKPKVGEKGTLHYYVTGRGKHIAYKLEKAGKAEKGSKKN
jgi:hypothetical protein